MHLLCTPFSNYMRDKLPRFKLDIILHWYVVLRSVKNSRNVRAAQGGQECVKKVQCGSLVSTSSSSTIFWLLNIFWEKKNCFVNFRGNKFHQKFTSVRFRSISIWTFKPHQKEKPQVKQPSTSLPWFQTQEWFLYLEAGYFFN